MTQQIGYATASQALGELNEHDALPYDSEQILANWPDVVRSLRNNVTIHEGFRLLSDAFYDLSAKAMRAVRYEKGLPIIPAWMTPLGSAHAPSNLCAHYQTQLFALKRPRIVEG